MAKSTDVRFTYDWMPNRYGDRIQRAAVLYPLSGRLAHTVLAGRAMTNWVLQRWRARLAALMAAGWVPRPQGHNTFLRNCCPTFVHSMPRTRPCKLDWICPFCYARWVLRVWNMVDTAFPNPRHHAAEMAQAQLRMEERLDNTLPGAQEGGAEQTDEGRPLRHIQLTPGMGDAVVFPYHLIERVVRHHVSMQPPEELRETFPTPESWLRRLLERAAVRRGEIMKRMLDAGQLVGGMYFTTVEPGEDGFWLFKHRQLLMVPANNHPPLEHGRIRIYDRPTRSRIFAAVAHVCRYPVALMSADPVITAIYLRARRTQLIDGKQRRAPRLFGTYGCFRTRRVF